MRRLFFTNPWASGIIRGEQIAARLDNAEVNPSHVHSDDVCIFVKCTPDDDVADRASICYIDVVDSAVMLANLVNKPYFKVIAIGDLAYKYMSEFLNRSDIILIPEHHCNFEGVVRDRSVVTRVGFCGYEESFDLSFGEVSKALSSIDVEFVYETQFKDRTDVCNFYKSIDIQLCFRKSRKKCHLLKNPLKLANAGSFKVPTISYPEPAYLEEWHERFVCAENLEQIVQRVKILKESSAAYESASERAFEWANKYHIDKIVPLYKELVV